MTDPTPYVDELARLRENATESRRSAGEVAFDVAVLPGRGDAWALTWGDAEGVTRSRS